MKKIFIPGVLVSMLITCSFCLVAQDSLKMNLKIEARRFFSDQNYVKAFPLYRELLNSFPREPEYQFSTGVCLVNLNGDLDEAVRLLKPAAVADYSTLSLYYLGRALHLTYAFEDAIKAYSKFILKAKRADIDRYNVERLIEMARNGLEYSKTGQPVTVHDVQSIQIDQLQLAAGIYGSGKLMKKPLEFCSKTDIRNDYRPWMFLPAYTEINEYVYVAGYETGKKDNKQLFRIRNINHETWGFPEPLNEIINTPYDEEYPFFDVKSSTLYFSSNGHSSMGGYDIFKSVYDWNTKSWSKPENIGFPINSPYDDFVYITDAISQSSSFVSTRASQPNQANIYRIRLWKETHASPLSSVDEIRKLSRLSPEEWQPEPAEPRVATGVPVKPDSTLPVPEKIAKSDYNKLLAEALILQVRADSAARITRDMRIMARETPNDSIKKQLITDILKNDREAKNLQREADLKFTEARKLKESGPAETVAADSAVVLSKVINGISVYQYRPEAMVSSTGNEAVTSATEMPETETVSRLEKKDDFSISDRSPYSDTNPIPMGIPLDSGLIYRIQLGVFSKAKPNDAFGGINPVSFEQVPGTTVYKYFAGWFYSMNGVIKALETIRLKGFPDAFVVAFYNGKLITTEKAREIEFSGFRL